MRFDAIFKLKVLKNTLFDTEKKHEQVNNE